MRTSAESRNSSTRRSRSSTGLSEELRGVVMNIEDPLRLAYILATLIDIKPAEKQASSKRTTC